MKNIILIIFVINITILFSLSIYDIQYTTNPGPNGTYPSPYEGQIVTIDGILNAIDFSGGRFFIIPSDGGKWNICPLAKRMTRSRFQDHPDK